MYIVNTHGGILEDRPLRLSMPPEASRAAQVKSAPGPRDRGVSLARRLLPQ